MIDLKHYIRADKDDNLSIIPNGNLTLGSSGTTATFAGAITGDGVWKEYTCSFTTSNADEVEGNGTIDAEYMVIGSICTIRVHHVWGSTTSGTGTFRYSLPFNVVGTQGGYAFGGGNGIAVITEAGVGYSQAHVNLSSGGGNQSFCTLAQLSNGAPASATAVTNTSPHTWGNTDAVSFTAVYEIA